MKRASIQEVARRSGVSHSTVSRALSGDPRISPATAERVRSIAAELAYQPNQLARGLKRGQSPIIGILNISTTQSFYGLVIREFEARARAEGIASVVCDTDLDNAAELKALEFLLEFPVRGVLVVGDRRRTAPANDVLARVWRSGTAVAAISGGVPGTDIPRVSVDNEKVGYLATRHLLDGGHRHIGYVATGLPDDDSTAGFIQGRQAGYRRALCEAGISPDPVLVTRAAAVDRDGIGVALERLLTAEPPATAVFAAHDGVALAVMGAALERGVHVPDDVAIVGVDDLPIGMLIWPTLTSVAQPIDQLAELALQALLRIGDAPALRLLEPRLIVRGSSAAKR